MSENCYYIASMKKVLEFATSTSYQKLSYSISKELLEKFLLFSNNILESDELYFIANERSKVIPIIENNQYNTEWNSQIIMPIFIDDRLLGSLIMTSYHKTFYDKHLILANTAKTFSKKLILNYLNKIKKGVDDFI